MKKKQVLSRKRRALRRVLAALVMLFLTQQVFHAGYLLPVQVIRAQEETIGCGRTTIVETQWEPKVPEAHRTYQVYLTGNENVTMIKGVQLSFLAGWTGDLVKPLDESQGGVFSAGQFWKSYGEGAGVCYLFGQVHDPKIQSILVTDGHKTRTVERADFLEEDGRTYFLLREEGRMRPVADRWKRASALDAAGNVLAEIEMDI